MLACRNYVGELKDVTISFNKGISLEEDTECAGLNDVDFTRTSRGSL